MCGIFGVLSISNKIKSLNSLSEDLFRLSESRGKDACGIFSIQKTDIPIIKSNTRVKNLLKTGMFKNFLDTNIKNSLNDNLYCVLGHSRMVTSGSSYNINDNQPVLKNDLLLLHNGIITNEAKLSYELKKSNLKRNYKVDTEVYGIIVEKFLKEGFSFIDACRSAFLKIKGANTIVTFDKKQNKIFLGTSNGSMYYIYCYLTKTFIFASEKHFLEIILKKNKLKIKDQNIKNLKPKFGLYFNLKEFKFVDFLIKSKKKIEEQAFDVFRKFQVIEFKVNYSKITINNNSKKILNCSNVDYSFLKNLKRCSKCILPSTFPFIKFDVNGVCNICTNYKPRKLIGENKLIKFANEIRKKSGPDCLVPLSGGRDSTFALHYIKNILKLNPVAYTYDWGFVTDLARRNISNICDKLNVEHVLIAADIRKKRENVNKNVTAWLKKPELGMIPLFMAGDKMFFYYANKLKKEMKLNTIFFSMNWLEKTYFKSGFARVNDLDYNDYSVSKKTHSMDFFNKIKLMKFYFMNTLSNKGYINTSIFDTLWGFYSFYLLGKNYKSIFDYIKWQEYKIEKTIIKDYDWELSKDTVSSWRIGDGTAPFYNYIYLNVAGFTEHDTFRSNQIRENLISRNNALKLVEKENVFRAESFKWYCDMINIDAVNALRVINEIPKLYH